MKTSKKLGLYIHIPFCIRKCLYCAFVSYDNLPETYKERYMSALFCEIKRIAETVEEDRVVNSIFIGGGTPSIMPASAIMDLMNLLKECFNIASDAEISMESNPGTLTADSLAVYKKAGINRLSMGVQSFDDDCLKLIGRIHDSETVKRSYALAREAGFDNINLDLMFSIPGLNLEKWKKTLNQAVELDPEHISFYSLQIEEGTPFYEMYKNDVLDYAGDEDDREMYHYASGFLKDKGYVHYEISNAAKPGRESRHNLKYWQMDEYIGFGAAAHSFYGGNRFANTSDIDEYIDKNMAGMNAYDFEEDEADSDLIFEYTFTGLRKFSGIELADFREKFGVDFYDYYSDMKDYIYRQKEAGYMFEKDGHIGLTLEGMDISNDIMSEFYKD